MTGMNERGAGRKKSLDPNRIEKYRKRYQKGETILALAREAGVSRQTMSSYLHEKSPADSVYYTYHLWAQLNRDFRSKNLHRFNLRIEYMNGDRCCSIILIDFMDENVAVINRTDNPILRAFGMNTKPSWEDFSYFLEERCIPKSRFQMKQVLKDLSLEQFDLIRILEKTEGRTGEDEMWLRFCYFDEKENA